MFYRLPGIEPIGKAAQLSGGGLWAVEVGKQFCPGDEGGCREDPGPDRAIVLV